MNTGKINNNLLVVRHRYGLTRKQVAHLLGYQSPASIARIEQGRRSPGLATLLAFEILYRTPVAYLYAPMYGQLRDELRAKEAALTSQTEAGAAATSEGGAHV